MKSAWFWGSVVVLTVLGYFVYPGHTYLQADTQIYVPMMERIYNPVLFTDDPMISRPHLALTAYDEIAIFLRDYAGLDFEHGLKLQQFLFRACAVAALLLMALRLGLAPPAAFLVAGLVILNTGNLGMPITDLEPVARSFAFGLLLLAIALSVEEYSLAAGIAAGLGFVIHPTTFAPFFAVLPFVLLRRAVRPIILAPLAAAVVALMVLMHFQKGGTESLEFFRRLDPFQEVLQRRFISLNFLSEWNAKVTGDCLLEIAVAAAAFWRLRERLRPPLRDWLWGLAGVAVLSIPFNWVVMDQLLWAMAGPWGPMRALVFILLPAVMLSAACGVFAAEQQVWWEAAIWFGFALALPLKELLATWYVDPWLIVVVLALVAVFIVSVWLGGRTRGLAPIAASILTFVVLPVSGLAPGPKAVDSPELKQLAAWALANTPETAVFLFADEGFYGGTGPFRARALRTIYADYEGRALVNYFPQFSGEWARRWRDVHEGNWFVTTADFQDLSERHIDYVVLTREHPIPDRKPDYQNQHYLAYRVIPSL